ncbi:alpha/beta hydrolase family protein [Arenicella chitinivorans]|nr:alpha/beta fold hydrolase [Arenicella chitinivorans]
MPPSINTIAFVADDGISNQLRVAETQSPSNTVILLLPAMGTQAIKYDALITRLAANGVHAASIDLRGHGASGIRASRGTDFSYTHLVNLDLKAALDTLRAVFPTPKIILSGHSLGGQIAALYLARHEHHDVCALNLLASGTVDYRGWRGTRKVGILFFTQFAYLISKVVGHFPGRRVGFAAREARGVMRDWAFNARHGRYELAHDEFDYETGLARVVSPVLAINFADDSFAPVFATARLVAKFSPEVHTEYQLFSAGDLGTQQAGHFTFLRHHELVATRIANWAKALPDRHDKHHAAE